MRVSDLTTAQANELVERMLNELYADRKQAIRAALVSINPHCIIVNEKALIGDKEWLELKAAANSIL